MIYFVQAADGSSAVKIGYTNNLEVRLKQLEIHYGRPMAVLHTLPGGRSEEAKLHRRFAHLRVGRTEQFRPEPDLMQFIDMPLFVNQGDVPLMEPVVVSGSIAVRATLEWVHWVEHGADHCRTDVSKLIDAALVEYLRIRDFEEEPPRRMPGKGGTS